MTLVSLRKQLLSAVKMCERASAGSAGICNCSFDNGDRPEADIQDIHLRIQPRLRLGAGFKGVRMVAIDEDWSALRFRRAEFVKSKSR
jgi:hypothetical protein